MPYLFAGMTRSPDPDRKVSGNGKAQGHFGPGYRSHHFIAVLFTWVFSVTTVGSGGAVGRPYKAIPVLQLELFQSLGPGESSTLKGVKNSLTTDSAK